MESKKKSLGIMEYPTTSIESFSGSTNSFIIKIETSTKIIRIKSCVNGVNTLVDKAREVVGKQRGYALEQWHRYKRLKEVTGYKSPEDGNE